MIQIACQFDIRNSWNPPSLVKFGPAINKLETLLRRSEQLTQTAHMTYSGESPVQKHKNHCACITKRRRGCPLTNSPSQKDTTEHAKGITVESILVTVATDRNGAGHGSNTLSNIPIVP